MPKENPITILESVDSTNNYAMGQAHAGVAEHGQAWLAMEQTQGKGQHGKVWQAAKGDNITMSIVLDTSALQINEQFKISATIAAACHAFIHAYAGDNVFIKWPNDIYWNDRKAGGILIENILQGQNWKWAVAGLGMNINEAGFPQHLPNPVSLRIITGLQYDVVQLAKELHQKIIFYWQQLTGGNWLLIYHYYNQFLYRKDEQIQIKGNEQLVSATLKGITEDGKLMIAETDELFDYSGVQVNWNRI